MGSTRRRTSSVSTTTSRSSPIPTTCGSSTSRSSTSSGPSCRWRWRSTSRRSCRSRSGSRTCGRASCSSRTSSTASPSALVFLNFLTPRRRPSTRSWRRPVARAPASSVDAATRTSPTSRSAAVSVWRYTGPHASCSSSARSRPSRSELLRGRRARRRQPLARQFRSIILPPGIRPILGPRPSSSPSPGSLSVFEIPFVMTGGAERHSETFVIQHRLDGSPSATRSASPPPPAVVLLAPRPAGHLAPAASLVPDEEDRPHVKTAAAGHREVSSPSSPPPLVALLPLGLGPPRLAQDHRRR